jgi:hypothetical protein
VGLAFATVFRPPPPVEADEHEARLSAASATSIVDRLATAWTLAGLGWDAAEWD